MADFDRNLEDEQMYDEFGERIPSGDDTMEEDAAEMTPDEMGATSTPTTPAPGKAAEAETDKHNDAFLETLDSSDQLGDEELQKEAKDDYRDEAL